MKTLSPDHIEYITMSGAGLCPFELDEVIVLQVKLGTVDDPALAATLPAPQKLLFAVPTATPSLDIEYRVIDYSVKCDRGGNPQSFTANLRRVFDGRIN